MFCTDFEYANEKLSDYGMILCSFDSTGMESVSSGADVTFTQVASNNFPKFRIYDRKYENPFTSNFKICKNPCGKSQDDMYLSVDEVSAIQRWLNRPGYNEFKIDQNDYRDIHWNATFSSKQIMFNGRAVGLELTIFTDAPYAYKDEISISYECKANEPIALFDSSDEIGYIYPTVEVQLSSIGTDKLFCLSNDMTNKNTIVQNCTLNESLIFNGNILNISSNFEHPTLSKDFNYQFPKIINTYENNRNNYTTNVDCLITFKYCPIRKIGL